MFWTPAWARVTDIGAPFQSINKGFLSAVSVRSQKNEVEDVSAPTSQGAAALHWLFRKVPAYAITLQGDKEQVKDHPLLFSVPALPSHGRP